MFKLETITNQIQFQKLDFENPNERKFLLVVVATEEKTKERLSSSATITVEVLDLNDNNPMFDLESYTAIIPESALPGNIWIFLEQVIEQNICFSFLMASHHQK